MRWLNGFLVFIVLLSMSLAAGQAARSDGPTAKEIADLVDDLGDSDAHVREVAHKDLVRLGAASVDSLTAAVLRPDTKLRANCLAVLAEIGPAAKPAVPSLVELAGAADVEGFLDVARTIVRIDPPSAEPLVKRLVDVSANGGPAAQLESLAVLASLGGIAGKSASAALVSRLGSAPPELRKPLIDTLVALGADLSGEILDVWTANRESAGAWAPAVLVSLGEPAVRAATQRLKSEDKEARIVAATALAAMGPAARVAVPELAIALKDETGVMRRAAALALGAIGADAEPALPALVEAASDPRLRIQTQAVGAIADVCVAAARLSEQPAPQGGSGIEVAVMWGLRWLKSHQSPDGHWDCAGFDAMCKLNRCDGPGARAFNPGVTGLALQCFLGAGETHAVGPHKDAVARGFAFLRDIQDSEGCFGPRTDNHFMYNHAAAALAMTEAYRLTRSHAFKEPAQRGVGFVLKAKNPYLGWRYQFPPDGDNDTSVTGVMTAVLKSASLSDLQVEKAALKDAATWIDKLTEPEFGRTGYQQRGGPPGRSNEMMQKFPADKSEALTAIGVLVRCFANHTPKDDEFITKGADLMVRKLPKWDGDAGTIDFYYWMHGSKAMRLVGGEHWKKWSAALKSALVDHQRTEKDRCERGSWDPVDPWSPDGGRIYATCAALLSLEQIVVVAPRRAPATPAVTAALAALAEVAKSDDPEVRAAAEGAMDQIRTVYR